MDLGLKDKLIVVTGGASGIGKAISQACLAEGARVAVLSKRSPGVDEFLSEVQANGEALSFYGSNLEDPQVCRDRIETVLAQHGRIDALVNNAGGNDRIGLANGNPGKFVESLGRNLLPAYSLAHYALPALKQTRGTIVNIASKVALTGQGNTSGYAASKGGLLALTREWAAELLPFGIRVNAVLPAEVMTPNYEAWLSTLPDPGVTLSQIITQIPLERRMTTPGEIAASVVFLLSPTQSGHTTGQWVHVDGGYVHLDRMLTARPSP